MKEWGTVCLVCVLALFLAGMGGFDGTSPVTIPEPGTNYKATVADLSGMSVSMQQFSVDGRTAISGSLGNGYVSVDFQQIDHVLFYLKDQHMEAEIFMKAGDSLTLEVDEGLSCYGRLPYGNFRINLGDIRSIRMEGEIPSR